MDDGREIRKISREAFPYPVFGRFAYTLSALVGLTLYVFDRRCLLKVLTFVRHYQTVYTRTAGHMDIGKASRLIFRSSLFLGKYVLNGF